MSSESNNLVALYIQIKRDIASSYPDFEARATQSWHEIISELVTVTKDIGEKGSDYLPQIAFQDLETLSSDDIANIQRKGSVIVRDVVDDQEAAKWKDDLKTFVTSNPVDGVPVDNKQFFQLFWTKSQVQARAHPNVLETTRWLNKLFHVTEEESKEVDLDVPLSYADRFRIRHPGTKWGGHPPHTDGGAIERWQDPHFRSCYDEIFEGNWKSYQPFQVKGRIGAKTSLYGRQNQASVFRTFQGWLSLTETAPKEGTLQVFPDVKLSNAYVLLRPFFTCMVSSDSPEALDVKNWKFGKSCGSLVSRDCDADHFFADVSTPDFPGVSSSPNAGKAGGVRPFEFNNSTHPHLALDRTMISVPRVNPGDCVFWFCDAIHAVENEHLGQGDSAVMYIPAMPAAKQNLEYVQRQKESFLRGHPPPDFPQGKSEIEFRGLGRAEDIVGDLGRKAMGL